MTRTLYQIWLQSPRMLSLTPGFLPSRHVFAAYPGSAYIAMHADEVSCQDHCRTVLGAFTAFVAMMLQHCLTFLRLVSYA